MPGFVKELSALLLEEHSRKQRDLIIDRIGSDPEKAAAAVAILCRHPYREVQRVAWVISGLAEKAPALVTPHLPELVGRLHQKPLPDAVKRNVLRILSFLPLPEELHAGLIDIAFTCLSSPDEPVAVKVFSMSVLHRLSAIYPEIRQELKALLEMELEKRPSPGIKSRAQKILSQLRKQG